MHRHMQAAGGGGGRGPWSRRPPLPVWHTLAATALALPACLSFAALLHPHGVLRHLTPWSDGGPALAFVHVLVTSAALVALVVARGLRRGKRRAADAAIAILLAAAAVPVLAGRDDTAIIIPVAGAALLFAARRTFSRGGGSRSAVRAGTVALASVTGAYVLSLVATLVSAGAWHLPAALAVAGGFLADGGWWLSSGAPVAVILDVLVVLALVAAGVFVHALLRPEQAADGHTPQDHARAATIVHAHARDSLDPFTLREDKAFHFAAGGFLAYRTLRETAVVSGDPVGPPGSAGAILGSFLTLASESGWDVVLTGASGRSLADYRQLGLRTLHIGNEAVVDPAGFTLEGRSIRKVRQSVTRARRLGWSVEVVEGRELDRDVTAELESLERRWRAAQPRLQGFAMTLGRLWGANEDMAATYVLARNPHGRVSAFLRFVDYADGLSLDVMRRSGEEPNGLNEALVVAALEEGRRRGVSEVSLNFAGFAHLMAADAALSRGQRLVRLVLERFHGRFQLERLVCFNEKFSPAWRPRYLVYGRRTHLPLAALRVLQAEAYLRPPRARPLRAGWRPLPHPVELVRP